MLKFVIIFLLQYLLSLLQYTHCLLIPVFTYEFTVFDITILTEILQYQLVKKGKKKERKKRKTHHASTYPQPALGQYYGTTSPSRLYRIQR